MGMDSAQAEGTLERILCGRRQGRSEVWRDRWGRSDVGAPYGRFEAESRGPGEYPVRVGLCLSCGDWGPSADYL